MLFVCLTCGAIVADVDRHATWHGVDPAQVTGDQTIPAPTDEPTTDETQE